MLFSTFAQAILNSQSNAQNSLTEYIASPSKDSANSEKQYSLVNHPSNLDQSIYSLARSATCPIDNDKASFHLHYQHSIINSAADSHIQSSSLMRRSHIYQSEYILIELETFQNYNCAIEKSASTLTPVQSQKLAPWSGTSQSQESVLTKSKRRMRNQRGKRCLSIDIKTTKQLSSSIEQQHQHKTELTTQRSNRNVDLDSSAYNTTSTIVPTLRKRHSIDSGMSSDKLEKLSEYNQLQRQQHVNKSWTPNKLRRCVSVFGMDRVGALSTKQLETNNHLHVDTHFKQDTRPDGHPIRMHSLLAALKSPLSPCFELTQSPLSSAFYESFMMHSSKKSSLSSANSSMSSGTERIEPNTPRTAFFTDIIHSMSGEEQFAIRSGGIAMTQRRARAVRASH
ncbi:hypothetical protein BDF19DRAFT_454782 [Syncephalis fuscata]|nr:hypothetical protein BDF19DRAFT_454782 [Syncephalis fuscata]